MNKPIIYIRSNYTQRRDTEFLLKKYLHHVDWKTDGGDVVLDVGCGPGDMTKHFLLSYIPPTIDKLIGVDISKEMIRYATETHTNPKLEFKILDIATKCLEEDMEECFDHIVSFYCLHWVHEQRQAYQNMYKMLKPGGNLFLTYVASHPMFDMYNKLSKKTKWAQYMTDVEKHIAPLHYNKSPEKALKKILEEVGYDVKICTYENIEFTYENREHWTDFVMSINPFIDRLPEYLKNDYLEEYINEAKQMNLVEKNNEEQITTPYKLFFVYAKKADLED